MSVNFIKDREMCKFSIPVSVFNTFKVAGKSCGFWLAWSLSGVNRTLILLIDKLKLRAVELYSLYIIISGWNKVKRNTETYYTANYAVCAANCVVSVVNCVVSDVNCAVCCCCCCLNPLMRLINWLCRVWVWLSSVWIRFNIFCWPWIVGIFGIKLNWFVKVWRVCVA